MLHKLASVAVRRGPSGMLVVRSMGGEAHVLGRTTGVNHLQGYVRAAPTLSPAEITAKLEAVSTQGVAELQAFIKSAPSKKNVVPAPPYTRHMGTTATILCTALSFAAGLGVAAWYWYHGCYKEVVEFQTFYTNVDNRARGKRIGENDNHWHNKMEYWWRTGIWVGSEKAPLPEDHKWVNYDWRGRDITKIDPDEED